MNVQKYINEVICQKVEAMMVMGMPQLADPEYRKNLSLSTKKHLVKRMIELAIGLGAVPMKGRV